MSLWQEDLSACTLQEILGHQAENREWSKELRRKTSSLVNSRVAKSISQDEYLSGRKLANEEMVECQRRASILNSYITRRAVTA